MIKSLKLGFHWEDFEAPWLNSYYLPGMGLYIFANDTSEPVPIRTPYAPPEYPTRSDIEGADELWRLENRSLTQVEPCFGLPSGDLPG